MLDRQPPLRPVSSARLYAAYQGGQAAKNAYPKDFEILNRMKELGLDPQWIARENRAFVHRAARYVTGALKIGQIVDIGAGLPAYPNVHETAQQVLTTAQVVYVDNDPAVLAHAEALLTSELEGATSFVDEDLRNPQELLQKVSYKLDFDRPVALFCAAVFHFIGDDENPFRIMRELQDALAPGSAVVLSHMCDDGMDATMRSVERELTQHGQTARIRSSGQIAQLLSGLKLVPPGLVPVSQWNHEYRGESKTEDVPCLAALGIKT
ncbi:SAM-dependent methyltransferase [Streptomyces sp. NPDC057565]|uniref:SAM-dependent methyltransferase n=1 Tax=Streptomyces sp. NPDC057565 TaxID=3346169 RepID=UPI00367831F8